MVFVIDYGGLDLNLIESNVYLYFCTAMDIQYGDSHIDLYEQSLDEIIDSNSFGVICNSVATLWVMLVILSLVNFRDGDISSMILGAIVVFVPQMVIAMFSKKVGIGGADNLKFQPH